MALSQAYEEILASQKSDEVTIETSTGLKIAAKVWGPADSETRALAVHGWLDNANTFDLLAPFLAANRIRVVCIDLIGHGKSPAKPLWSDYSFIDYLTVIVDVVDCLGWKKYSYIGHSMGAAIGSMLAAALPESIESIILLDALGPVTRNSTQLENLSQALRERDRIVARQPLLYNSREEAAAKYRRNNPFISERGATHLLARGTSAVISPEGKVAFQFVHDPRLVANSPVRYREEEVLEMLASIQCPVLLILGSSSALQYKDLSKPAFIERFKKRVSVIKDIKVLTIDGSHHVHLDNPEPFAQVAVDLLLQPSVPENPDVNLKLAQDPTTTQTQTKTPTSTTTPTTLPKAKL